MTETNTEESEQEKSGAAPAGSAPAAAVGLQKRDLKARRAAAGTFKLLALGVLILVLWVPLFLVQSLVKQRSRMESRVAREIGMSWGAEQTVLGPVVTGRYSCVDGDLERPRCSTVHDVYLHAGPKDSNWSGTLDPQLRSRGIYETVVWQADLTVGATFDPLAEALDVDGQTFELRETAVSLGLSDTNGLEERGGVTIGETRSELSATSTTLFPQQALTTKSVTTLWTGEDDVQMTVDLRLRGTRRLSLNPTTGSVKASLKSTWPSPSFSGSRLPVERSVTEEGFVAEWQAATSPGQVPATWFGSERVLQNSPLSAFGVDLIKPVDGYRLITRCTKYGLLFIVLTFATFFLLEVTASHRLHPVQYLLAGAALCVFYLLLLSLTEHVGFGTAYLVASIATIGLVTLYAWGIARRATWGIALLAGLSSLYGYLYVVLQLEDFALLMGSIGLFAVLAVVMYLTRRFDWFTFEFEQDATA